MSDVAALFAGGGHMGELMASHDWARTPLGPVDAWPQSLRTIVSTCLASRFPILVWWGRDLVKLYNDAYATILGAKHPRALGQRGQDCWPEIWDIIGPMLEGVLERGEATWSEDQMLPLGRHGFSEECYFTFSYSPIRDESGGIGGVFTAVTETTERVLAERRLATLRVLGESATGTTDVATACASCLAVLAQNRLDVPYAAVYLRDGDEIRLQGAPVGLTEEWAPGTIGADDAWHVREVLASGITQVVHRRDVVAQGGPWPESVRAALVTPIARPGSEQFGVLVAGLSPRLRVDDKYRSFGELVAQHLASAIASARAYEEERRRAEALAEIDRAKTAFFSSVSHEFRTPLTLLLAPIEELRAEASSAAPAHRERAELLYRNALRLLKLVNSLLDFARIEAGRATAVFEPTDLSALTGDIASSFRSAMEKAGLSFSVDCPKLRGPVHVDHDMWEKIVLNLLSNAFKFTFEGGVSLRLHDSEEGGVELEVSDTGAGIPQHEVPRLFERFHRVEGVRSRSHEGSGIGLALAHELVRLHGGSVQVESELGRGSTFRVRIPRGTAHLPSDSVRSAPGPSTKSTAAVPFVEEALRWIPHASADSSSMQPAGEPVHASRERILVVDDNADMREYIAKLLAGRWDVETAADGEAALRAIRRSPPDFVLSDVMMPVMDGVALVRALRADASLRDVPVVLLSARAGEEATAEGLATGADDYLVKPFTARELLVRVAARLATTRASRKVAEHRTRLFQAFEQAPFPFAILRGREHVIEIANGSILAAWGKPPSIIGRPLLDTVPELQGQPFPALLDEVFRTAKAHQGREAVARLPVGPQGELVDRYYDFVYAPMFALDGAVDGIVVAGFDVSDRVVARQELGAAHAAAQDALSRLAESRARSDYAVRLSGIGFWYCDLPFDELRWDRTVKEHFFLPSDARVTIETFYDQIVPEDRDRTRLAIDTAIRNRSSYDIVYRTHDRASGRMKWIRAMGGTTYASDGTPLRFDGVTVDISAQKLAEQSLAEARAQAEEASRAKDDFLAMLGHELRNPLAPIATAVHLLKLRSRDNVAREVNVIERQSQHIARLVDDLLDISRIARGKVTLHRENVEVADLVATAIETASSVIENAGHALIVNVPTHGLAVYADCGRMAQVLSNLLTNAAKYTPAGGRITLTASREGPDIVVSVQDTGIGVPADLLPRVFDMFVQARQTLDRAQGGLGLGLALVKNLTELHGGTVSAHSEGPGRGSTFTVRLPTSAASIASQETPSPPPAVQERAALQRTRILVVDDNADGADMLSSALEDLGYMTAVAYDGPEALRVAAEFAPHAALLDIGLPVMDGYELASRLRAQWSNVKLVAVTGYGQESDRERARGAGFQAHLTKPVDIDKLERLVAKLCRESSGTESRAN